jgi:hypothetical protein
MKLKGLEFCDDLLYFVRIAVAPDSKLRLRLRIALELTVRIISRNALASGCQRKPWPNAQRLINATINSRMMLNERELTQKFDGQCVGPSSPASA